MAESLPGRSVLGTFALVFIAIVALFGIDEFLARMEQNEMRAEAARRFEQGKALMEHGDNGQAVRKIKDAIAIERKNRGYQRTLAEAEFADGETAEAESTLTELLRLEILQTIPIPLHLRSLCLAYERRLIEELRNDRA